jgi:hypothetical protein
MRITVAILALAFSFIATCGTACVERPVRSVEDMARHCTGYPLRFICQNLNRRYDPQTFPQYFAFANPKDTGGFDLEVEEFLISWAVVFVGLGGVAWLVARIAKPAPKSNAT